MPETPPPPRPAFVSFYPSDWKAGTATLTPSLEWTYLQVCLFNWDKGKALPKQLQEPTLGRNPDWRADVATLLDMDKLASTASGALMVPRAVAEFRKAQNLLEKKVNAGRKGAKNRWKNKDNDSGAMPDDGRNGDMVFSVPPDLWRDFREHRTKIKAPMTERAERGILKRLEEIQAEHGDDPAAVLEQTIRKGWRDVFPLKGDGNGRGAGPSRDGLFDAGMEWARGGRPKGEG